MATSTIILYKDCKIDESKHFVVDSLEDYLGTLSSRTFLKTQFIRHDLSIEVKLDLPQDYQEFLGNYNYNYCSIINSSSSKKVYYFIINKKQLASNTIKLILEMDTINTFKPTVDFDIDDKTLVLREHKDRIKKINLGDLNPSLLTEFELTISSPYEVITYEGRPAVKFTQYASSFLQQDKEKFVEAEQLGINTFEIYYNYDYSNLNIEVIVIGTLQDLSYFDYNFKLYQYYIEDYKYFRNIDFYSENISPLLYKTKEDLILQEINTSWNLIYQNKEGEYNPSQKAEPIECYLLPDMPLTISYTGSPAASFGTSSFNANTFNIITASYLDGYEVPPQRVDSQSKSLILEVNGEQYKIYDKWAYYGDDFLRFEKYVVEIENVGASLTFRYYKFVGTNANGGFRPSKGLIKEIFSVSTIKILNCPEEIDVFEASTPLSNWTPAESNKTISFASSQTGDLKALFEFDRTDAKLIKIIKLPYIPTSYKYENNILEFSSDWVYNAGSSILKLQDLNTQFNYTFNSDINPFEELEPLTDTSFIAGRDRNDYFESKIFNSEFYYNKFVYDSFGFIFRLECINLEEFLKIYENTFKINFITTTTINSKFAFIFPDYILKYSVEDYDNVLTVARNNEVSIYNSQYLNYIRTGYNYDLKALERSKRLTNLGVASSIVGGATGSAIALATGSISTKISSVVGTASSITTSIINGIESIKSQEENIERRLLQSQNQATSISGSDDLDLMVAYTGNKAKLCKYEISERMKNALYDLFYYTGYAENSTKIPNVNTRLYFNYLSCELEFMENTSKNIPEFAITRIKELYKGGITFLHKVNGSWNFEQDKENFEVSLM